MEKSVHLLDMIKIDNTAEAWHWLKYCSTQQQYNNSQKISMACKHSWLTYAHMSENERFTHHANISLSKYSMVHHASINYIYERLNMQYKIACLYVPQ